MTFPTEEQEAILKAQFEANKEARLLKESKYAGLKLAGNILMCLLMFPCVLTMFYVIPIAAGFLFSEVLIYTIDIIDGVFGIKPFFLCTIGVFIGYVIAKTK